MYNSSAVSRAGLLGYGFVEGGELIGCRAGSEMRSRGGRHEPAGPNARWTPERQLEQPKAVSVC